MPRNIPICKEVFRTCNVLPFSCTHLALWRQRQGKRPKVHAKQKGFKNFFSARCMKEPEWPKMAKMAKMAKNGQK